jgi:hypothetical protein
VYRRIGGRALIFAGWLVSATLYAGALVDSEDGNQAADVTGYGWQDFQDVCPYNGSQFMCSGSVDRTTVPSIFQFDQGAVAPDINAVDLNALLAQGATMTRMTFGLGSTDTASGAGLSRDPSVPNPATVAFIGISLVGLGWSRPTKA